MAQAVAPAIALVLTKKRTGSESCGLKRPHSAISVAVAAATLDAGQDGRHSRCGRRLRYDGGNGREAISGVARWSTNGRRQPDGLANLRDAGNRKTGVTTVTTCGTAKDGASGYCEGVSFRCAVIKQISNKTAELLSPKVAFY